MHDQQADQQTLAGLVQQVLLCLDEMTLQGLWLAIKDASAASLDEDGPEGLVGKGGQHRRGLPSSQPRPSGACSPATLISLLHQACTTGVCCRATRLARYGAPWTCCSRP